MVKKQRVDKVLSNMGLGTRKDVKQLVKQGKVVVNDKRTYDPGIQVDPVNDKIEVNGKQVIYKEFAYYMLNKPQNVVSATEDNRDQTVVDLLEKQDRVVQVFPVGRLDKDTEGLLLLTNDGQLAHELLSPKKHIPKTYYAKIEGKVTEVDCQAFEKGVVLEDGYQCLSAQLKIIQSEAISEIEVVLYEGKFHQVKRMFQAVGKKVIYLKRIAMGELCLDQHLALGQYRELTKDEIELLKQR